jgi:Uma2 family endonuclease
LQLRIPEASGGQTHVEKGYIVGAPELVIEVSKATRTVDLGAKKGDYERAGVREYVFVGLDPQETRWFVRRDGGFVERPPDPDGIHRSEAFPGLWFDAQAFFAEDMERVFAVLEEGLATPAHAAFAAQLAARAGGA